LCRSLFDTFYRSRKPAQNVEETREILLDRITSSEKPWIENYAILLRSSQSSEGQGKPRMIGIVGAPRVSEELDAAEVAYGLHPDFWGLGYMSEALGLFIRVYWAPESMFCYHLFLIFLVGGGGGARSLTIIARPRSQALVESGHANGLKKENM
jgi:hypothetical protein